MKENITTKPNGKLVGSFIWLFLIIIAVETFLIFRPFDYDFTYYISDDTEETMPEIYNGANKNSVIEYFSTIRDISSKYSTEYNDNNEKAIDGIKNDDLNTFEYYMNELIYSQESFYYELSDVIPPDGLNDLQNANLTRVYLFIEYLPYNIEWRLTNGSNNYDKNNKYNTYINARNRVYYEYTIIIDKYDLRDDYEDIFHLEKP